MIKNKKAVKLAAIIGVIVVFLGAITGFVVYSFMDNQLSKTISVSEAQQIVDETFGGLPTESSEYSVALMANVEVKVLEIKEGEERNFELKCSYSAVDAVTLTEQYKQEWIDEAYKYSQDRRKEMGIKPPATEVRQILEDKYVATIAGGKKISGEITLYLYEVEDGQFVLWLSPETVDTCTGGMLSAAALIDELDSVVYEGRITDISSDNTLRTGVKYLLSLVNYDSEKPVTGNFLVRWIADFKDEFHRNFIEGAKWKYLLEGLGTTLAITGAAGLIGVILGFIVAIIRCTCQTTGKLKAADAVCRFYLTVIRGTPVMVQLLIIFFVILLPMGIPKFTAAVICFGLNSGAYVAEIVRGGIMSVDKGQNEAGRSLGFNFPQTMWHFIVPQAFKAVLPALANEFITLLKESSVAFYIGVADLTQGGLKIRSITYSNFMPLIAVALIYLAIVLILTRLVGILERRLRKSDH